MPVAINLFGSSRGCCGPSRLVMAGVGGRLDFFLDPKPPTSLLDKVRALPKLAEVAAVFPKTVRDGPATRSSRRATPSISGSVPVLQCWPEDGGRFITMPLVITKDPATGGRTSACTGCRSSTEHDRDALAEAQGRRASRDTSAAGRRMEVAVAIGGDPATVFAPAVPLPPGIDEFLFAGFLRGEAVELVRCVTVDLEVPARAEIVLEGYVDPDERRREGPFGDHTGFYSLDDDFPVFHVTAVTRRETRLPDDDRRPAADGGRLHGGGGRAAVPAAGAEDDPRDRRLPPPVEGVFHNLMIVAIDKRYPRHARKVMHAIWGSGR